MRASAIEPASRAPHMAVDALGVAVSMENVLLAVHLIVCIGLVVLVLMQRSEGGALGIGGGGGGALMSGRGAADAIIRITGVAGALFFLTSLALTFVGGSHREGRSVVDTAPAPISAPAVPGPSGGAGGTTSSSTLPDMSGLQTAAPLAIPAPPVGAAVPTAGAPTATTTGVARPPVGATPAASTAPVGAAPVGAAPAGPASTTGAARGPSIPLPSAATPPPAAPAAESSQGAVPSRPKTGPEQ